MDIAYLHLLVNHFPVILSVVGAAAAIFALIVRRRGVWLYAAVSLTLSGISVYPVMLTGHGAEHEMNHRWYVVKESIEEHEDAADVATWVLLGSGLVNAFAWWLIVRGGRNDGGGVRSLPSGIVQGVVLVTALASAGTVSWAAFEGGQIVHNSPRLAAPPLSPVPAPVAPPSTPPVPAGPDTGVRDTAHVAPPSTTGAAGASSAPTNPASSTAPVAPVPSPAPHPAGKK